MQAACRRFARLVVRAELSTLLRVVNRLRFFEVEGFNAFPLEHLPKAAVKDRPLREEEETARRLAFPSRNISEPNYFSAKR